MSKLYAISARVQFPFRTPNAREYGRTVELPTFYLCADVQGIVSEDHARRIAVDMIASLGHSRADISVQVTETSIEAHR